MSAIFAFLALYADSPARPSLPASAVRSFSRQLFARLHVQQALSRGADKREGLIFEEEAVWLVTVY